MAIRIGISGWRYAPWRGVFYPKGLPQRQELEYASRCFNSVEINGSFYSLQTPRSYSAWHEATPDDFMFSVKGPRYVTHMLRLQEVGGPLANFFASGILRLGSKLGPILWQLPPTMRYDPARIEGFLSLLPADTSQALSLARRRDVGRMRGRSALAIDRSRPLRHAMEVRHDSFCDPAFIDQLRRHRVAWVVADTAGKWPFAEDVTSDFIYVRLHGDTELYASGYGKPVLERWAAAIRRWGEGREPKRARRIHPTAPECRQRDVFCYFDNDIKAHAPFDARTLIGILQSERPGNSAGTAGLPLSRTTLNGRPETTMAAGFPAANA
ncbi:MAG: hypothetical protein JWL98_773 [Xanthomonadaceae bacterium]|nr:hypothetical protein [Xanthomonadaceae bacterium]